jgi:uroporphyrin-III C-methyltransferase/precorrin-2 dehydrogenase/sirohydrochlorin ferrochelatase
VLVGGGPVAAGKLAQLRAVGADVLVVAPAIHEGIERSGAAIVRREFVAADLDGAWLAVAAATPDVNQAVAAAAGERRIFVNAVDDPANATAYLSGVVRRDGVTLAISTQGAAPGLTALLREALDAVLPDDLGRWVREARRLRRAWRRSGVPMAARRPLLLEALIELYDTPSAPTDAIGTAGPDPLTEGHVSLVGAGPGDPGLLTRTALARLRAADLVLYDALVDARVLACARRAQRFFVGKRAGRHALSQADIHSVMIRAARRGRRVVRLKGGDPFVFGRGGEEALALKDAGIPFDVVPGISSAIAAAVLAGIPVTHRGLASSFLTVSGHDDAAFAAAVRDVTPGKVTLVILMGAARRERLARQLMAGGWPESMPSAIVAGASTPDQQVWRGSLGELASGRVELAGGVPAAIVVGETAALDVNGAAAEREDVARAFRPAGTSSAGLQAFGNK